MNTTDFLKYLVKNQKTIINSPIDVKSAIIAGYSQSIIIQKGYEEEEKLKKFFKEKFPNFLYPDVKILTKSDNGTTKNGEADFIIDTVMMKGGIPGPIFLFEFKRRDDHDSKKKEGEVRDLKNKGKTLQEIYPNRQIKLIIYFRYDNDGRPSEKYYKDNDIIPKYGKDILSPFTEEKVEEIYATLIDDEKINVCDFINLDNDFSKNVDECIEIFSKKNIKKIINLPEEILQVISPYDTGRRFISRLKKRYSALPEHRSKYTECEDEQFLF